MSFEQQDHLTETQIEDLHRMYQSEWWTKGRKLPDVRRMLENSDVIIAFCEAEIGSSESVDDLNLEVPALERSAVPGYDNTITSQDIWGSSRP